MHTLQMLFEEADIETRSYSGRSMYGKACLGVTTDNLGGFIADVIYAMQSQLGGENVDEIAEAFRGMTTDSMGRGTIVYFPNVPFSESHDSEDAQDANEEDEG